jgi:surface antigen
VSHLTRREAQALAKPQRRSGRRPTSARTPRAARQHGRHPFIALLVVVIVPGFFAATSIPALAFGPQGTDATGAAQLAGNAPAVSLQSLTVASDLPGSTVARDSLTATTEAELRLQKASAARAARVAQYNASGARAAGDDYPWPLENGGLSPLNYFYRQCVDFVAWRLNRDAGSTTAPFKYTWSYLTPSGGNASQWKLAWQNHGWPMSTTPVAGSVAWFTGNHVAYVKTVNGDGTVTIEEYNWNSDRSYHTRTIAASSVPMFLYPPP